MLRDTSNKAVRYGYRSKSGWNAMLPPRAAKAPLAEELQVDFAVVGAGYSGLATARRLAELKPDATIVVLDANEVGEGASGRNSGFISSARAADHDGGRRQWDFSEQGLREVRGLVDRLGIECELRRVGGYRCSATERGHKELELNRRFLVANNFPHRSLSRAELKERIGTDFYDYGLFIDHTYLLQPAALIRGLADTLPEQVRLHEHSPVTRLTRRQNHWELSCPGGVVTSRTVVLAANSFVRDLGYLSDRLLAVLTYAGLTEPLPPEDLDALGSDAEWGVSPTFKYGTTMRRLRNGRLMLRSLYSYESELDAASFETGLRRSLRKHFPHLEHLEFEFKWGGVLSMTRGRAPFFGALDERLYAAVGCNGSGIAKFNLLGKLLAEEILGQPHAEYVRSVFGEPGWIPPEPIRKVGFAALSSVGKWIAGKDV